MRGKEAQDWIEQVNVEEAPEWAEEAEREEPCRWTAAAGAAPLGPLAPPIAVHIGR